MASVKYGTIVTELKGSIGGLTFQKCGSALSVRSNPKHKQAFSVYGQTSRNTFAACVSYWRGLSLSQKAAWAAVASTYPTVDKWGNPVILNGFQIFMYLNRFRLIGFTNPILTAVSYAPFSLFSCTVSNCSLSAQTCYLQYVSGQSPVSYCFVYVSNPYPGSSYRPYAPTFFVQAVPVFSGVQLNFYSYLMAAFRFTPVVGQMFSYECWSYHENDGQFMFEFKGSAQIVT